MPMANQTISRNLVVHGRKDIRRMADIAPAGATNQTHGVLNLRGRFGSRTRRTRIPAETITNASKVPIEHKLPASRTVNTAEKKATAIPVMMEVSHGVRKRGCTRLTTGGNSPSLAIV